MTPSDDICTYCNVPLVRNPLDTYQYCPKCYDVSHIKRKTSLIQYHLIETDNYSELQEAVNYHLNQGWKCQGGISISLSPSCDIHHTDEVKVYAQAVIKEE